MCTSFWGSFSELRLTNDLAIKKIHKLSGKMAPLVILLHESEDLSSMQITSKKARSNGILLVIPALERQVDPWGSWTNWPSESARSRPVRDPVSKPRWIAY